MIVEESNSMLGIVDQCLLPQHDQDHQIIVTTRDIAHIFFWLFITVVMMWTVSSSTTIAGEAQYAYDDLGCLTTVVDDAGNTAIYNYDVVGNLVGIDRFTPGMSGIGIYTLLPGKGRDRQSGEDSGVRLQHQKRALSHHQA